MTSNQRTTLITKLFLPLTGTIFLTFSAVFYLIYHSFLLSSALATLLTLFTAVIVYFFLQHRVLRPLKEIRKGAEYFADGNFSQQIPIPRTREFADLAQSLNQMAEAIQQHDQVRKDFVANVSHELKTPITSIKGYLEMLTAGALNDPENSEKFLGIVSAQTERLIAIIDDLLALSYLESSNRERVEAEIVYLSGIIDRIVQYNSSAALKKKIDIIVEVEDNLSLKGNPLLFEQMIGNLLENAIKYSENEKSVRITAVKNKKELKIIVADEGRGISAHHLDRIFERFYRVDKARSRNAGGTGLGLAIVKHIAQMYGGGVSVESQVGEGSSFIVTFSDSD